MTTTEHRPLNATQQLNAIAAQLAELHRDVKYLLALASHDDPLEDRSADATRALMARNERRARGEACPECQDTGMVLDALGAIPCPVCSPCIRAVDDHPMDRDGREGRP